MTVMDAWLSGHLCIYFSVKVFSVVLIISTQYLCAYIKKIHDVMNDDLTELMITILISLFMSYYFFLL